MSRSSPMWFFVASQQDGGIDGHLENDFQLDRSAQAEGIGCGVLRKVFGSSLCIRRIDDARCDRCDSVHTYVLFRVFYRQAPRDGLEAALGNHRNCRVYSRDRVADPSSK
jgi:hypothetical protein